MYIHKVSISDAGSCWRGGYAVIRQGTYEGKPVAVKMPHCNQEIPNTFSVSSVFSILDTVILIDDVAGMSGGPHMATA
jgi:hypothetical protein